MEKIKRARSAPRRHNAGNPQEISPQRLVRDSRSWVRRLLELVAAKTRGEESEDVEACRLRARSVFPSRLGSRTDSVSDRTPCFDRLAKG